MTELVRNEGRKMMGETNLKACVLISIFFLGMACTAVSARTIYIDDDGPADFDNIQAAINDANDGDTVLVADGTYTGTGNRDIDFLGKAINVRSENGPDFTIIDCQNVSRGFYFHSGEDANSILDGFIIENGSAWQGGGIKCTSSGPTIKNCIIRDCIAHTSGIMLGGGGGIHCEDSRMTISNCLFLDNKATGSGGAICSYSLTGSGHISVLNCIFKGNWTGRDGGAILSWRGNISLRNCVIAGNTAGKFGGGIRLDVINPTITNCTIVGNSAGERGGGLFCWAGSTTVVNSVLWDNTSPVGSEVRLNSSPFGTTLFTISYCDIEGGPDLVSVDSGCTLNWGSGNIDADPCFATATMGDFHLRTEAGRWDPSSESWVKDDVTSPCIDAGDPSSPIGAEPFPNSGIINMGAYGGTEEASKSYFGLPNCETIVAGDINGDCKVNFLDFRLMAIHWLEDYNP